MDFLPDMPVPIRPASFISLPSNLPDDILMFRKTISVRSQAEGDIIDITQEVRTAVRESGTREGLVHLFVRHSTAALTTIEYESGVLADLKRSLSILAPDNIPYAHDSRWGDGNGRSHVKAALVGPSLTVPVAKGDLMCGTWQQIVLLELDVNAGRERTVICTVTGE
jgi:secondary thiamine-phosphate synthase enzyme